MTLLVAALRYKLEGRGFDSRWLHNLSGRTTVLGLTQPLTELSTSNISWRGKGGRCLGLTTSYLFVLKSGSLKVLEPSGAVQGLLYL